MRVTERNNVNVRGTGEKALIFAHGFGCDQNMWRFVTPAFEDTHKIVLFDNVGAGKSDSSAYNKLKYETLQGYADDVLEICEALELERPVFVGHSVSSMIGALAAIQAPEMFEKLIMVGPSPCYINKEDYIGGFSQEDILELLESLDSNYLGWSTATAPAIMGNPDRPELGEELTNSFCRTNPEIAKHFARTTFLSDNRADLKKLQTKSLILQCSDDMIAPVEVGEFVHRNVADSEMILLEATGHCPNLSAPEETIAAIKSFL
ncbi:alpha/beta hydrolase [Pontibacter sp. E15-1]|uniref:alpha/beta fold hydrolase n=1 Tax=Pontibacter sp. E15-1 TaxID=2919918 RepID=UPI001F4F7976|nr:alpha/beta hydrolase [Pontibacter sp. E15-1]MCJ8163931.1 alpha/beta hydrolase [Pontibacter sp. E15-1]